MELARKLLYRSVRGLEEKSYLTFLIINGHKRNLKYLLKGGEGSPLYSSHYEGFEISLSNFEYTYEV